MHTFTAGMGSKSLQPFSGFVCPGLSLWVVENLRQTKHKQSLFSTQTLNTTTRWKTQQEGLMYRLYPETGKQLSWNICLIIDGGCCVIIWSIQITKTHTLFQIQSLFHLFHDHWFANACVPFSCPHKHVHVPSCTVWIFGCVLRDCWQIELFWCPLVYLPIVSPTGAQPLSVSRGLSE